MNLQEELTTLSMLEVQKQALTIEAESRIAELKLQIEELAEQIKAKESEVLKYVEGHTNEVFKDKSRVELYGYRISKTNSKSLPLPSGAEEIDEIVKLINDNRAKNPKLTQCYNMRPVLSREAISELSDESLSLIGLSRVTKTSYKLTKL
ncbi:TPA: hypothetical protein SFZ51_000957 [Campylobacter jejuni]|uniref:Host-nuclease inhibitor protein Gam n=1 Tax=Campylobacter jejuni TaxID=197 RepID=A0A431EEE9_CAMJU|nr:host-nuclease inhibitor Gam family protein [Campylobacter jejuni]RTJ79634.1 hypothetical protein C3H57_04485 [Campylobacter jejuni]HEG8091368.1 hypothetical protein [Campylobacter jejuni]HEG8104669.1 hypothetical protein [Campylobacter jejuni]HEG8133832.1 hypothetical protein [Campylobacter jejuni]